MPTSSSADFALGNKPLTFVVYLARDFDFYARMRRKPTEALPDPNWEAGTEIKLVFTGGTVFNATIIDDLVVWDIPKTEVNTLLDLIEENDDKQVLLTYKRAAKAPLWGVGRVSIRG